MQKSGVVPIESWFPSDIQKWLIERDIDKTLLDPEEEELFKLVSEKSSIVKRYVEEGRFEEAIQILLLFTPVIDKYFEDVLINHSDPNIKINRLSLLCKVLDINLSVADWLAIEKKGF